jgi:hypothetical protein
VSVTEDVADFILDRRRHGQLAGDATEPTGNGYILTIACPCGVTFYRWVHPWTLRPTWRCWRGMN